MKSENINFDKLRIPEKALYSGIFDQNARFITEKQLMDPARWALFVSQFKNGVDGTNKGWRGEYWGKMMRGASMIYRYTGDRDLYSVLEASVRDMMSAQEEDGRISSYSRETEFDSWDMWCRKYVMLGMQYFYDICEDEALKEDITSTLKKHLDYIMKYIGPESEGKKPITKATRNWHGLNSSSILEPVMRLYNVTKEQKYLSFAAYIISEGGSEGYNVFEHALNKDVLPYQYQDQKAYEMMSCFEGLLEYYRVTGDEKCRLAAENFAEMIRKSEVTLIGTLGCVHENYSNAAIEQTNPDNTGVMQETCVTVTWMKFCLQLLRLTGDSKYADEIERSMYNDMLGDINFAETENGYGLPFDSYAPLMPGPRGRGTGGLQHFIKPGESGIYGCCACIGSAGVAIPLISAVLEGENGIYVNFYMNGRSEANGVSLTVNTAYPYSGKVDITVENTCDSEIKLRIPAFSKKSEVYINNVKQDAEIISGSYLSLKKNWSAGDSITLILDVRAQVISAPEGSHPNSRYHFAVRKGPVVLARDSRLGGTAIDTPCEPLCDSDGYIELTPAEAPFNCNYCCKVPLKGGGHITMVDFASAGATWDENSMLSIWLPTKKYWNTDLVKPIVLWFTGDEKWIYENNKYLTSDENGNLIASCKRSEMGTERTYYALEAAEGGYYRIKNLSNGRYITAMGTAEGSEVREAEGAEGEGKLWLIKPEFKDKYHIYAKESDLNFMRKGNKREVNLGRTIYEDHSGWFLRNE